ncbi:NDR1/HIN1-like protein 10 [Argentina anserina]|uniref:NDR1/HIN1-like protein 10 n=1 Tax=Argentina anserina TaxID=57926 RepID=UPI00217688DA|nr:NDR1/HIN1-like protein 10 [Potentilla anserina]
MWLGRRLWVTWSLERRAMREAGFTEQRLPPAPCGGRITGRCLPDPQWPARLCQSDLLFLGSVFLLFKQFLQNGCWMVGLMAHLLLWLPERFGYKHHILLRLCAELHIEIPKLIDTMSRRRPCCICFCSIYFLLVCFTLSFLIFWLIFLPQEPKIKVTNASLTQFNFNNTNNTLSYHLAINITIRNPNKRVGIYYRRIQVIGKYRKKRFALETLTSAPFYQGHKNTTDLQNVHIQGSQLVEFGKGEISQFNKEAVVGVYSIEVQLAFRIKARFGKFTSENYKPHRTISCKLKVPLSVNGTSSIGFEVTKCGNIYFFNDPNAQAY